MDQLRLREERTRKRSGKKIKPRKEIRGRSRWDRR